METGKGIQDELSIAQEDDEEDGASSCAAQWTDSEDDELEIIDAVNSQPGVFTFRKTWVINF